MSVNDETPKTFETSVLIPLEYWFKRPSFQEIIDSYPDIDDIRIKLDKAESLSFDELILLKDKLYDLQNFIYRKTEMINNPLMPIPLIDDVTKVCKLINDLGHPSYEKDLKIEKTEKINGYELYDITRPLMPYDEFAELVKKWKENKTYSFEKFSELCDEEACTEWSKMDREGNSFGGYYNYPKDSVQYMFAPELTKGYNFKGLYELPYPKEAVIKTVKMGCDDLMECVRFSNFVCEWIKRKKEQLCI